MERKTEVERVTKETKVKVNINIDGKGEYRIDTGIPFLDHMLSLMAKHGFLDLNIEAKGDLKVDFHHTVEDIGICLGEALAKALKNKEGIVRYGTGYVPMDEALALVSLDISNRPLLVFNVPLDKGKVGEFDVELTEEFFRALSSHSGITTHINLLYGDNIHHIMEAIFKAFGKALDQAVRIDERIKGVLSTKGKL